MKEEGSPIWAKIMVIGGAGMMVLSAALFAAMMIILQ